MINTRIETDKIESKHKIEINRVKTWLFKKTNNIGKFQMRVNEREKGKSCNFILNVYFNPELF